MSRMVIMDVFNALTNFESQIQSYKHDTEVRILFFVNKDRFLLKLTYVMHWNKFPMLLILLIKSFMNTLNQFNLFTTCNFVKEMFVLDNICKQI